MKLKGCCSHVGYGQDTEAVTWNMRAFHASAVQSLAEQDAGGMFVLEIMGRVDGILGVMEVVVAGYLGRRAFH